MKQKQMNPLFLILFCLLVFPLSMATATEPLSMAAAIEAALQRNPEVLAARHQTDVAVAQADQARSPLLPQLEVSESFSRTTSPLWAFGTRLNQTAVTVADFAPQRLNYPDAVNNFTTALTLSWQLFDGGQSWIGWSQARTNHAAADLALQRSIQQVTARTAADYTALLLSAENRKVIEQALETAKAHLKVVEDRSAEGLTVKSDLLRAQVRIADLAQQLFQAQSAEQISQARLQADMGLFMGAEPVVPEACGEAAPPEGSLEEWVNKALEQRPDLKQIQLQEDIAKREIDRAGAGHFPTLALQGNYERNSESYDDSADNYTLGAVVRMNLYSGQRISSQKAAAQAMLQKLKAMRENARLGVQVETQQAFFQAQSAWQSIAVAEAATAQAEEAQRIVANRYQSGLLNIVNLLDAQVAYQQARTQHCKARYDYQIARIGLALAAGAIDHNFH